MSEDTEREKNEAPDEFDATCARPRDGNASDHMIESRSIRVQLEVLRCLVHGLSAGIFLYLCLFLLCSTITAATAPF